MTFAATGNAALYLGADVKFVDVQEDTGNLDPELLEAVITEENQAHRTHRLYRSPCRLRRD